MIVLVFNSINRQVSFEPSEEQDRSKNGLIHAKSWCNSIALETGNFSEYSFNSDACRHATKEELTEYTQLKAHSKFALNAD